MTTATPADKLQQLPEPDAFQSTRLLPYETRWFFTPGMAEKLGYTVDKVFYSAEAFSALLSRAELAEQMVKELREALQFYAEMSHFHIHDECAWDTVSGEPPNFFEDEHNTATVEDGSIARAALAKGQQTGVQK